MIQYRVEPAAGPLRGEVSVPGDKSVSHRAVLLAALAEGESRIHGFLDSADTRAMIHALRRLGVEIERRDERLTARGVGMHGLRAPTNVHEGVSAATIDCGNSGTAARLLLGVLAAQDFDVDLTGDASLRRRPMRRVAEPLNLMGASVATSAAGAMPVRVRPAAALRGIRYAMPVASAQVKSALLLAGLYADGKTTVIQPAPCRDHTERMLPRFGCPVRVDGAAVAVERATLRAATIRVPGDISSAAFFLVAASIVPGSDLLLPGVGMNPTRHAVVGLLRAMGADIDAQTWDADEAGEPQADLRVRYRAPLHGIDIPPAAVPLAIDELPALLIAAAAARGETTLRDAAELRVKESDRIAAMAAGLRALGVKVSERQDGLRVRGGTLRGGEVDSRGDHRIAMAFSIAGLAAADTATVRDCANIDTSFPGFDQRCRALGAVIERVAGGEGAEGNSATGDGAAADEGIPTAAT